MYWLKTDWRETDKHAAHVEVIYLIHQLNGLLLHSSQAELQLLSLLNLTLVLFFYIPELIFGGIKAILFLLQTISKFQAEIYFQWIIKT